MHRLTWFVSLLILLAVQGNAWAATGVITAAPVQDSTAETALSQIQANTLIVPVNPNGTLSATQSVTTTESYLAAPANSNGVLFESDSTSANNVRWGFSSSTASILSTTTGMLMEPGRSQWMPFGYGSYLHLIATSGTAAVNVQWVKSQ
jgi:hypothetical protein